jgi:teichuronic acid biosynthesis glycosyltransferase TuaG
VQRAIDSALAQAAVDVDVIVVDDGSVDGTTARIGRLLATEPRLRLICLGSNNGPAHARNVGIAQATGRYLAFLDHDDCWVASKLRRQIAALEEHDAGLCYTGVEVQNLAGATLGVRQVPARIDAEQLLVHNVIAASSVLIDRTRVPPFRMPALRRRQDLATWHTLLRHGVRAVGVQAPLTVYTRRPDSLSANKLVAAQANWHLYRTHLDRPLPAAVSLFTRYAAAALRRV